MGKVGEFEPLDTSLSLGFPITSTEANRGVVVSEF